MCRRSVSRRRTGWSGRRRPMRVMAMRKPEIVFVCVHNAGRSQMAAALVHALSGGRVCAIRDDIRARVEGLWCELGVETVSEPLS